MERYIGIVTAVSGQRAKVRIERGLKKGEKPRILDCWNTCEAKKGTYVEVEEQTLGERQGKWIVRGIPLYFNIRPDPQAGNGIETGPS